MLKTKHDQNEQIAQSNLECYKIIRKSYVFLTKMEEGDFHNNRIKIIYETLIQSFDVTEYVKGDKAWRIPEEIPEEIRMTKILGILPKEKILGEGFIYSYSKEGIEDFLRDYNHNQKLYGKDHFNHDLVIYHCVIPAGTAYYAGKNNGYDAFASKALKFIEEVKI